MITNLVVLSDSHTCEDGSPKKDATIYHNRILCHPSFKEQFRDGYNKAFPEAPILIFVSDTEWQVMNAFSRVISGEGNYAVTDVHKNLYQDWWSNILDRALREHNEYIDSKQESKSEKTPADGVQPVEQDNRDPLGQ
jgi:hypothetical protein